MISNKTLAALDELSCRMFWMNKKLDRMKAVLSVKFTMPVFSELVHLELSHKYPLIADKVNDIQDMFNRDYVYLGVEGATEDYESVSQMMNQLLEWTLETNDMLNETIKIAKFEDDDNVYWMLGQVSLEYSNYVSNAILLRDKSEQYGGRLGEMDFESRKWWKL